MSLQIPEPIARAIAQIPKELEHEVAELVRRVVTSPNPRDALARALQVTAHEKAADAAVDAMFEAKKRVPGSGV
jgi:hypothetical protein